MSDLPLFVLYGSATGNSEVIAKDLAAKVKKDIPAPFTSVVCCEGNAFKKKCIPTWEKEPSGPDVGKKYGVVVVISTTGNGDAPENGSRFTRYLKRKTTIASKPLGHCAYGVLALGDTNYDKFCESGKVVDSKFIDCGGVRAMKLMMADEATGLEEVVEEFVENIIPALVKVCSGGSSGAGEEEKVEEVKEEIQPPAPTPAPVQPKVEEKQQEEEKKMEAPDADVPKVEKKTEIKDTTSTTTATTTLNEDILSNTGVTLVEELITVLSNPKLGGASVGIPKVDPKTVPLLGSSLSSCKLVIDNNDNTERKSHEILSSELERMTVSSASSSNIHYTINHPYESTILNARYLTKTSSDGAKEVNSSQTDEEVIKAMKKIENSFPLGTNESQGHNDKRVIEMTLSLPDDFTLEYQPGDSIGLLASNTPEATQFLLSILETKHGLNKEQLISIDGNQAMTVDHAIRNHIDLCSPIKKQKILASLAQHATNKEEANALNFLASNDSLSQDIFRILIDEQRISFIDLLKLFPSCQGISLDGLLAILPRIPPRYYSICSSPLKKGEGSGSRTSLKVAFSVVDYMTPKLNLPGNLQRRVGGLVTRYLETIASSFLGSNNGTSNSNNDQIIQTVKIFPKPTADFRLPSNLSLPMILIGPGTGIAPFIGFLEHRQAQIAANDENHAAQPISEGTWRGGFDIQETENQKDKTKKSYGEIDVYFGCRYSDHDWLYEDEMKNFQSQNTISTLNVAFSRENPKVKSYVQDKMKANAKRIADMIINKKAVVYICGDGNHMAKDVQTQLESALEEYYSSHDDKDVKEPRCNIERMKAEQKLLMDIWS
jgi:sulfite reductase alpha subunit-like flavoprotein